jgi:hypothetical protein
MKLTPWFDGSVKPVRNGRYRAQDMQMNCSCCWIELEWRNGEWFSNLFDSGRFNTHFFTTQLRRWRGLAQQPKGKK